ncbi:MAG: knotted carbamoyltransferase YgeW, partial [Deltaproteobacteria bacterium]
MDTVKIKSLINQLSHLDYHNMYLNDFLLTWEKSDDEVWATFLVADILRGLRQKNISSRIFDSGLGISLFRDQ